MNLKKLTQAVFQGLPSEYRWAAVDANAKAFAYTDDPEHDEEFGIFGYFSCADRAGADYIEIGRGYDTTDWQNSLIERQNVPTKADIDWSRQDVPEGATYYRPKGELFYRNDHGLRYWSEARERWIESGEPDLLTSRISELVEIRKPEPQIESIHDVARSIEAARVAEKSGNRCATCTANICSVIDDCYVQRAQEESARIEEQACMPWPDGDARYFETSDVPETKKYPHYFKDVSGVDAIDLYHVARLYDITDPALFHAFKKIACAGKRGAKDRAQDVQEAIDAMKRWQELNV